MVIVEKLVEWRLTGETCPSATLSTTNPTWQDPGLNPGCRGGKRATNRLSYGAAARDYIILGLIHFDWKVYPNWTLSALFVLYEVRLSTETRVAERKAVTLIAQSFGPYQQYLTSFCHRPYWISWATVLLLHPPDILTVYIFHLHPEFATSRTESVTGCAQHRQIRESRIKMS
jgi:hypothetical protein